MPPSCSITASGQEEKPLIRHNAPSKSPFAICLFSCWSCHWSWSMSPLPPSIHAAGSAWLHLCFSGRTYLQPPSLCSSEVKQKVWKLSWGLSSSRPSALPLMWWRPCPALAEAEEVPLCLASAGLLSRLEDGFLHGSPIKAVAAVFLSHGVAPVRCHSMVGHSGCWEGRCAVTEMTSQPLNSKVVLY